MTAKDYKEVRDQQINIYLSEREKIDLDALCFYYFNMSRADFLRVAMFIATHDEHMFMAHAMKARDDGYLTMARHRRKGNEEDITKRHTM